MAELYARWSPCSTTTDGESRARCLTLKLLSASHLPLPQVQVCETVSCTPLWNDGRALGQLRTDVFARHAASVSYRHALLRACSLLIDSILGGMLWVIIVAWRRYLQRRLRRPRDLLAKYGPWAVVTGATGGLGMEFVELLAAQGFNVVITSRGEPELERIAQSIRSKHGVQVATVAADLATAEGQQRLIAGVEGLDVGLLIHNAGLGYVGPFAQQNGERINALMQLNVVAPVNITSALLPALQRRKRSGIIFVSSLSAFQPLPLHAVYAASKAFLSSFGVSLWEELKGTNIDVLVTEPSSIATGFASASGTVSGRGASPLKVARETLNELGLGRPAITPSSLFGWLRSCVASLLPRAWITPFGKRRQMNIMTPAERAALARPAQGAQDSVK